MRPFRERINRSIETRSAVVVPFPIPQSDFGLVAALRNSHPEAVQVLCERYSDEMLTIATRILGPDSQIPQVVIDTIRQALAHIDESFEPREFHQWLFTQLIDKIRHRLRAQRWRRLRPSSKHSWAEGVGCSERVRATYGIIERMDETLRVAFCLVAIHSLDIRETAKLLGLASDQVEQLLDRALAFFVEHVPRAERNLARRKLYYLSLSAEIVQEQDLVIEGWWISEDDILCRPAQPRSSIGRLMALLPVLLVLACAASFLVAQTGLISTRPSSSDRATEVSPMRPRSCQGAFNPLCPDAINRPTAAWIQSPHSQRAR